MRPPVGRAPLFNSIRQLIDDGCPGVVLTGPAGVGKTFLATALLEHVAASGFRTDLISAFGVDDVPLGALSRALPDTVYTGVSPSVTFKRYLAEADEATLFHIDDADMLDAASLAVLVDAAQNELAQLIITIRSNASIPAPIERALTAGTLQRVQCGPLDLAGTADVANDLAGATLTAGTLSNVHDLTRGNPLYIRELIAAAREGGQLIPSGTEMSIERLPTSSDRLTGLLHQRLSSLDEHERDALLRIALVGEASREEIDGFVEDAVLISLEQQGLINCRRSERSLRFEVSHPLHTEIILSIEPALRVDQIRREHADRLLAQPHRSKRDQLRLAAWSLDNICDVDGEQLRSAALSAASAGDYRLARRLAEAAFALDSTADTAAFLAARQLAEGDFVALREHFARWESLIETETQRATFESVFTQSWFWRGHDASMIQRAIDSFDSWTQTANKQQLQAAAAIMVACTGAASAARDLCGKTGDIAPGQTWVVHATALGHALRMLGQPDTAARHVATALDATRAMAADLYLVSSLALAGLHLGALADAGRFAEHDQVVAAHLQAWEDAGPGPNLALAKLSIGNSARMRGRFDEAVRHGVEATAGMERVGHPSMARWGVIVQAQATSEAGDVSEAEQHLRWLDAQPATPAAVYDGSIAQARAWVAHHKGLTADALRELQDAVDWALPLGNVATAVECWHAMARFGHADRAISQIDAVDLTHLEGALHAARLRFVRAAAARSREQLEACIAVFDQIDCAHLAAESALAAARVASSPSDSKRLMNEAAIRERPGENKLTRLFDQGDLTGRERQVALLATQGLTSKQIAEHLGTSRRTVDTHLGRVYTKLRVDGRLGLFELTASA